MNTLPIPATSISSPRRRLIENMAYRLPSCRFGIPRLSYASRRPKLFRQRDEAEAAEAVSVRASAAPGGLRAGNHRRLHFLVIRFLCRMMEMRDEPSPDWSGSIRRSLVAHGLGAYGRCAQVPRELPLGRGPVWCCRVIGSEVASALRGQSGLEHHGGCAKRWPQKGPDLWIFPREVSSYPGQWLWGIG